MLFPLSIDLHVVLSSVSIYNLVNIYNSSHQLTQLAPNHFINDRFSPLLSDETCTTALDLHRLLRHFDLRNEIMTVLNSGGARHRFREAKMKVLAWLELEGSPNIDHMCSECTELMPDPDVPGGCLGKYFPHILSVLPAHLSPMLFLF